MDRRLARFKSELEYCSVTMDTIVLEAGTVEFLPLQDMVEVVILGMLEVLLVGLLEPQHNPLEG